MRKVPSVGFSLDATAPVPNRTLLRHGLSAKPQSTLEQPPANTSLSEHLEAVQYGSEALRTVLLALAAGFKEVAGHSVEMPRICTYS